MNAQIQSWDDLRYFLAVARAGGLAGAARALRVHHATVFRRIGALEGALGARLFERQRRGYALTAAGEEMLAIATRIEDDVHALDRRVSGHDQALRGVVRVTTVEEVLEVLAPHLVRFRRDYPGISLEIDTDVRQLSLSRREADVAIRPGGKPTEPDLIGRRLCNLAGALYASRGYLAAGGRRPRRLADVARCDVVGFDASHRHLAVHRWLMQHADAARVVVRTDGMMALRIAVRAGFGVGLLPCFMCDGDPELVRLLAPPDDWRYGLWLVIHADLRQTARVRAFVDFAAAAIATERPRFEGLAAGQPRQRARRRA